MFYVSLANSESVVNFPVSVQYLSILVLLYFHYCYLLFLLSLRFGFHTFPTFLDLGQKYRRLRFYLFIYLLFQWVLLNSHLGYILLRLRHWVGIILGLVGAEAGRQRRKLGGKGFRRGESGL